MISHLKQFKELFSINPWVAVFSFLLGAYAMYFYMNMIHLPALHERLLFAQERKDERLEACKQANQALQTAYDYWQKRGETEKQDCQLKIDELKHDNLFLKTILSKNELAK